MESEPLIFRDELTAMLFAIADINPRRFETGSRTIGMARKNHRKMTPDERARQRENQERFDRLLRRRLEQDGTTREEIHRRLGLPPPPAPSR